MFGKKKMLADQRENAKNLITIQIAEISSKMDSAYVSGMIELAFELGLLNRDERADYTNTAYAKGDKAATNEQPKYKKKGCYEYKGYYILKDFAKDAGDGSACWCVKPIGSEDLLFTDLAFKAAIKAIDDKE